MAVVKDLITITENQTLSFGDYSLAAKTKKADFMYEGDIYKIKTFSEITKLEKNGMMVYESVPGTAVHNLKVTDDTIRFMVEAAEDVEITLGLEPDSEYKVYVDNTNLGKINTNLGGKLTISVEFNGATEAEVKIVRA
ncbi:MAG: endosialidase [Lachnospiraceae bacterium]|nr:endosialidase [Lachnospiraceae bacterium]